MLARIDEIFKDFLSHNVGSFQLSNIVTTAYNSKLNFNQILTKKQTTSQSKVSTEFKYF